MFTRDKLLFLIAFFLLSYAAYGFDNKVYAVECLEAATDPCIVHELNSCEQAFDENEPNWCFAGYPPGEQAYRWKSTGYDVPVVWCDGVQYIPCTSRTRDDTCCLGGGSCQDEDPSAPANPSPTDGNVVNGLTVSLNWDDVASWGNNCGTQVNEYRVYVQTSLPASGPLAEPPVDTVTSSNYTYSAGSAGQIYYWQIAATNGVRTTYSPIWSFRTNSAPYGTMSSASTCKEVGSTISATSSVSDKESNLYGNQIYRRERNAINSDWAAGSDWVLVQDNICNGVASCSTTGNWTPSAADTGIWRFVISAWDTFVNWDQDTTDPNNAYTRCSGNKGTYWVRCDASNDLIDFTVANTSTAPSAPSLQSPANGATAVPLQPTFSWSHNANFGTTGCAAPANSFTLQLRTLGSGTWQYYNNAGTPPAIPSIINYTLPDTLTENTTYEWRVCAKNGAQETCSEIANFRIFTTCGVTAPAAANPIGVTFNQATATLSWSAIGDAQWGSSCGVLTKNYRVDISTNSNIAPILWSSPLVAHVSGTPSYSANYTGSRSLTYYWRVATLNGSATSYSAVQSFVIPSLISGWIWDVDSFGESCSGVSKVAGSSDINGTGTPPYVLSGPPGTWTNSSAETYQIDGVTLGTKSVCATVPSTNPNLSWRLKCNGSADVGSIGSGCVSVDVTTGTKRVDLGYQLTSTGWYTSLDGNVFAKSIGMGIPKDNQVLGGFDPYLGAGDASVLSSEDISVVNADDLTRIAKSDVYAKNLDVNTADVWLSTFSFTPPEDAEEFKTCSASIFTTETLDPSKTYKISADCLNKALKKPQFQLGQGVTTYKLSSDGVAVVYVYDNDDELTFGEDNQLFRAEDPDRKILFVIGEEIDTIFSKDLGEELDTNVSPDTRSHVEASFLTNGNIIFEAQPQQDPQVLDYTIVVDGPIVSSQSISFNRDKGINNGYPAEVIKWDPLYLTKLADQESAKAISGLSLTTISWQLGD